MFRSSMRSSSGCFFISLSMLLILKNIKIFKKCYHSVVVMWQHMSSVLVMRIVWRRELQLVSTQYAGVITLLNILIIFNISNIDKEIKKSSLKMIS
jgi:hypothetical protein